MSTCRKMSALPAMSLQFKGVGVGGIMVGNGNEHSLATYLVPGTGLVMLLVVCPIDRASCQGHVKGIMSRLTSFLWEWSISNPVLSNHIVFIILKMLWNTRVGGGESAFADLFSWERWASIVAQILTVNEQQGQGWVCATWLQLLGHTLAWFISFILVFSL